MESHVRDRIVLRFLSSPADASADHRTVQAGSVLEWIDKAGYACAVGWAGSSCVTAYVGNVNFDRPIRSGELVEARARVIHTGRTSIHVNVAVSSADPRNGVLHLATHCVLIFVSVDEQGNPQPVTKWQPQEIEDLEFSAGAEGRVAARAEIHAQMKRQQYSDGGTAPRITMRFLAAPSVANFGGNAHGGTVMRWIDDAARTCGERWAKLPAVAAYSGGIHFYRPIHIGDLVEVESRLIHTGPRSMHVATHVRSGSPASDEMNLTTLCMSILVVKGADGRAAALAQFIPETIEDAALDRHAVDLAEMRAALKFLPVDFPI